METLILILFVLGFLLAGLQLSFMPKKPVIGLWLAIAAVFVFATHTRAIEQSYDIFSQQLANTALITDFVVVLVAEAVLGIFLVVFMIRNFYGEPIKKAFRLAVYFPGFSVFPALFYGMSLVYLNAPAFSFMQIAVALTVVFPLLLYGLRFLFLQAIPEFDLRTELKFILHILQVLGAIILSIQYLKLPVSAQQNNYAVPLNNLLLLFVFTLGIIGLGILKHRLMRRLQVISKQKRK